MSLHSAKRRLFFESLEQRQLLAVTVDTWEQPVVLGNHLIFVASDATTGAELWRSDGTEQGTVLLKDIRPGTVGSKPSQLTVCGNYVYFTADNGTNGVELWRTDGTANGTVMVRDIDSGASSSNPDKLTTVGNTLYFIADNGTNGTELWKSDGTSSGTVMVRDIWAGANSGCGWSSELATVGNSLYFSAQTAEGNYELWKSDGTSNGTTLVKEIRNGTVGSYPANLTAVGSTLYFTADDGTTGTELWKSDGTSAGTVLVKDVYPGATGSVPSELLAAGNTLYFTANNGTNGIELWKSDGTATGTVMVRDIYSGANGSNPTGLVAMGATVYFAANNGTNGVELWKSDGTSSGTVMVKDIRTGSASSSPAQLTVVGNTLYFTANDGVNGVEIWKSDGTANGTAMVKDIRSGSASSNPIHLTPFKGTLFFVASDDFDNYQLFSSNGTSAGTMRVVKPVIADKTVTLDMPKTGTTANQWTVRRNAGSLEIVNASNSVVFSQSLLTFNSLVINASGMFDDKMIIDFSSGGGFSLPKGLTFNGTVAKSETLQFTGSSGDDVLRLNFTTNVAMEQGLGISVRDVETLSFNGGMGTDSIEIIGADFDSTFSMSDNLFVMMGGGSRLELRNFNMIDAIATGHRDTTYIYGEKNSLIAMNDVFVERRATGQAYRVWYSEQVTAINMDDSNNAILHTGSRGYDTFTLAVGYGTATNAVGSYIHECSGFKNIIISTPMTTPTVSLPTSTGWTKQSDRGVWTQNGYTVTVLCHAKVTTRDGKVLSTQAAASLAEMPTMVETQTAEQMTETTVEPFAALEESLTHFNTQNDCNENLFAFLADEQLRLHKKKDKWHGEDDWLAEFEKLTLLELRKGF